MQTDAVEQRWRVFLVAFGAIALFNEAVLMPLARETDDGAFLYVTLKFVLLPAAALGLLITGFVQLLRARTRALRLLASIGVGLLLYLAELWWRPLPWFAGP